MDSDISGAHMAAADPKNRCNCFRLLMLITDVGHLVLQNIFNKKLQEENITFTDCLSQEMTTLEHLQKQGTISKSQFDLLYPASGQSPSTSDFDITLKMCLLRNLKIFGLNKKSKGTKQQQTKDTSLEGNLNKLKQYLDETVLIATKKTRISLGDFQSKWKDIQTVLHRLNESVLNPVQNLQKIIDDKEISPLETEEEGKSSVSDGKLLKTDLQQSNEKGRKDIILEENSKLEKDTKCIECQRSNREVEYEYDNSEKRKSSEMEWRHCIDNGDQDQAKQLLRKGRLPNAALLDRACQKFSLKSPLLKDICTQIEEKITAESDYIIYTNACYTVTDHDKIVFVVITGGATDYVDLSKVKYNVLVRSIDYCSQEGRMVIDKEMGLRFEDSKLEELEILLQKYSPHLMKKHSNLTLTTGSMFKSQNQGAGEIAVAEKVSIVLYVTVKGLIPVGEDLFPTRLGNFDTDVREGRFYFAVGGKPGAKHKNVKPGCRISCKDGAGTIGGFVQHPKHGICAITCAHVVLSVEEILGIRKKNNENPGIGRKCFQPNYNTNEKDKCGQVVEVRMLEGDSNNAGVDAALVKIDDDRIPNNGHFPDCGFSDIKGGCSHCKESLLRKTPSFKNGTVLDIDEITTNNNVVKYGQKTKFTIGMLKVKGGSARIEEKRRFDANELKQKKSKLKRYHFLIHNILEVNSLGPRYAEAGDSGALVFSQDDDNTLAAFGLLLGYDTATSITLVQPICPVLEHVGLKKPLSFINFDPRERRIDNLEKDVNEIKTSLKKMSEK